MAQGWYELKLAKDGQFMFNLKAANSQVILTSELYKTRAAAENGIASVQKNGADQAAYEIRETKKHVQLFTTKMNMSMHEQEHHHSGWLVTVNKIVFISHSCHKICSVENIFSNIFK